MYMCHATRYLDAGGSASEASICVLIRLYVSSYAYMCVLIDAGGSAREASAPPIYVCPHTPIYVSAYAYICVLILLCICVMLLDM